MTAVRWARGMVTLYSRTPSLEIIMVRRTRLGLVEIDELRVGRLTTRAQVEGETRRGLVVPQRIHQVDARRTPRRQCARDQPKQHEEQRRTAKRQRVGGRDPEQ